MVATIYSYCEGKRENGIKRMFEFDNLTDQEVTMAGERIRMITFFKNNSTDAIDEVEFREDPLMIFIMENGKTVESIRYKMDDII